MDPSIELTLPDKIDLIKEAISKKEKVLVAFSGGVDSSTLAALTFDALGDNALAVTLYSPVMPQSELEYAKRTAELIGIRHIVLDHDILSDERIRMNDPQRCYYCKKQFVKKLKGVASEEGLNVIMEGTNASEITGRRPGLEALREAGSSIFTPYVDFDVSKEEVRQMASCLGLDVANRPSNSCLLSRLPYGSEVTSDLLGKIETAEDLMHSLGISSVRVRVHDDIARVEVQPVDIPIIIQNRMPILSCLKEMGYPYVTLDLEGFRSGSMDEVL